MPSTALTTGPAVRRDAPNTSKGRHPLLRNGTYHHALWDFILHRNKDGGVTAAQMFDGLPTYHPQQLADLQKARLVAKAGKIGRSFHVADPAGRGITPQQVQVEIELYETETGAFVTRTILTGRQEEPGKLVAYLGSRTILIDVPGRFGKDVKSVVGEVDIDPDYDEAETYKLRKAARAANVIIES